MTDVIVIVWFLVVFVGVIMIEYRLSKLLRLLKTLVELMEKKP